MSQLPDATAAGLASRLRNLATVLDADNIAGSPACEEAAAALEAAERTQAELVAALATERRAREEAARRVRYYEADLIALGPVKPYAIQGADEAVLMPEPETVASLFQQLATERRTTAGLRAERDEALAAMPAETADVVEEARIVDGMEGAEGRMEAEGVRDVCRRIFEEDSEYFYERPTLVDAVERHIAAALRARGAAVWRAAAEVADDWPAECLADPEQNCGPGLAEDFRARAERPAP